MSLIITIKEEEEEENEEEENGEEEEMVARLDGTHLWATAYVSRHMCVQVCRVGCQGCTKCHMSVEVTAACAPCV